MGKILHVMGSMDVGGIENMVMNILRRREPKDFDFVSCSSREGYFEAEVRSYGGKVYHPTMRSVSFLRHHVEMYHILKGYRTVHFHTQNAFLTTCHLLVAKAAGVRTSIVHCHNTRDWRGGHMDTLHRLCRGAVWHLADVRLSCGAEASEWMFGGRPAETVPLPVDCPRYISRREARKPSIYLHVGRFDAVKNHAFLIRAFRDAAVPGAELWLAGDGPLRGGAERLAEGLPVRFLGNADNVPELMAGADAFLLPSLYEGFPTVLLEAQAAGLPCLVADTVTRDIDLTGLVSFLPLDAGKWADGIRGAVPAHGRWRYNRVIAETYDAGAVADRLGRIYAR